jgi:predicted ATPase
MNELNEQQDRVSPLRMSRKVRFLTAEELLSTEPVQDHGGWRLPFQELLIEGLLSFGEKTHFEFGQLNILVGPNGSGKSNLIDCIRLFRAAPLDIQETFRDSSFDEWLYQGNKESGSAFLRVTSEPPELPGGVRHEIRLVSTGRGRAQVEEKISNAAAETESTDPYFVGSYRSEAKLTVSGIRRRRERKLGNEYNSFQSILSQIRDVEQYPEITRLAALYMSVRIYSEWTFGRNSSLREATPTGRTDTMLSESMNDLALALNGLSGSAAHEKIRDLLQELKETYLDYVTRQLFGRVGLELVEAPFEQLPLPAKRLSDGTLRFLALAVILLQPAPPPLICLEEPELGMHPDMIRIVAGMIADASAKTQLIVTTHSEHLLTALQDDFDVLFAFDAGLDGSVVRRFSRDEYKDWRRQHTLGELWTTGELGGNRW